MAAWEAIFKAQMHAVLNRLLQQGYELPLYVAYIGKNGSITGGRYDEIEAIGLDFTMVTFHIEGQGMVLPIHMLVVDQRNQAVRVIFARDAEPVIVS